MTAPPTAPDLDAALVHAPQTRARLREGIDRQDVRTIRARTGVPVVAAGARKLHSGRDPVGEAERYAGDADLDEVDVIVLLGFGSGYVARALARRTDAAIICFEPRLDVLAEGVEHGDLPSTLRIAGSPLELQAALHKILRPRKRGVVLRWPPCIRLDPNAYDEAVRVTREALSRAELCARTARLRASSWLHNYLANLPHLARDHALPQISDVMPSVPAIVVAAGPSLDRNIDELRRAKGKAVILAVNTAAGALAKAGITPDAIVCVESLDISAQLRDLDILSDTVGFLELTGHPSLWELPFAAKVGMSVDTSSAANFSRLLHAKLRISAGFCVAHAATAIALRLGCPSITLVGSDLAFTDGRVYAGGTLFQGMRARFDGGLAHLSGLEAKRAIEASTPEVLGRLRTPEAHTIFEQPAWGGAGVVATSRDFMMFRDWYAWNATSIRDHGVRLFNATEGGMEIPGWEPLALRSVLDAELPAPGAATTEPTRPSARLRAALTAPGFRPDELAAPLSAERRTVDRALRELTRCRRLLGPGKDADLALPPKKARRVHAGIQRVRDALHQCFLAADAVHAPLDRLLDEDQFSTTDVIDALEPSLTEHRDELARTLQRIVPSQPELRKAS